MSAPQLRTVAGIQYQGQHRDVKNLILRVREDGTVTLSVPRRVSWKQADLYVELKAEWIAQAQQRQEQRAQRRCLPLLSQEQALAHFLELSSKVYPAFADVLGGVAAGDPCAGYDQLLGNVLPRQAAHHLCKKAVPDAPGGPDLCGGA